MVLEPDKLHVFFGIASIGDLDKLHVSLGKELCQNGCTHPSRDKLFEQTATSAPGMAILVAGTTPAHALGSI